MSLIVVFIITADTYICNTGSCKTIPTVIQFIGTAVGCLFIFISVRHIFVDRVLHLADLDGDGYAAAALEGGLFLTSFELRTKHGADSFLPEFIKKSEL